MRVLLFAAVMFLLSTFVSGTIGQDAATSEEAVCKGSGTLKDPFSFGQLGDTGQDFSLKVTGHIQPADQVVEQASRFNDPPEEGMEYVIVSVSVTCHKDVELICSTDFSDYDLVGSEGLIYDWSLQTLNNRLDVEMIAGGRGKGDLVFEVQEDESDLLLLYRPIIIGSENPFVVFKVLPAEKVEEIPVTSTASIYAYEAPSALSSIVAHFAFDEEDTTTMRNDDCSWLKISTGWIIKDLVEVDGDLNGLKVAQEPEQSLDE